MSDIEESGASTPQGVSRRTVTKAMAWAVPAVAVAAAAPAFAASGKPPIISAGAACKLPGNSCKTLPPKGYQVPATIQNPDPTKTIWITAITISNNTCGNLTNATAVPAVPFSVTPGQTINVTFVANASSSANQACSFDFEVTWGHASDGSDHDHSPIPVHVVIPSTPPDCVCPPA
ncbi:hypothetical protein LK09_03305 [Microbacterium mangrovi]|uniref:HYR domain-containing protein n=1 Tax=Microbacterium mangrovi TaxID=1348253 RepID=A0A0B2ACG3_9MICO|nr:hypothetical protein [Microbacterium mangrovi]KHK99316.1 hypothetical protein LK09_03305 [Microbacterium mangrovi]